MNQQADTQLQNHSLTEYSSRQKTIIMHSRRRTSPAIRLCSLQTSLRLHTSALILQKDLPLNQSSVCRLPTVRHMTPPSDKFEARCSISLNRRFHPATVHL